MRLTPALEFEKLREDAASWNKVILHRDGKFYHAYDWSAWLIKQYVCTFDRDMTVYELSKPQTA